MNSFGDIGGIFIRFVTKMGRIIAAPFIMLWRKIIRLFSPNSIMSRMSEDIRGEVKDVATRPKSLDQYFIIGKKYVAKKLVFVLVIILILLMVL